MHITKNMELNNFMISGAKAESQPLLMIPIRSLKVPQLRIILSSQKSHSKVGRGQRASPLTYISF